MASKGVSGEGEARRTKVTVVARLIERKQGCCIKWRVEQEKLEEGDLLS